MNPELTATIEAPKTESNRTYVGCHCGWRSRRTYKWCECDVEYHSSCGGCQFGKCPKCGGKVESVRTMIERKANDAKTEAFWASVEGQTEMARIWVTLSSDELPPLEQAIEDFKNGECSPEKMAAVLYKSAMGEDEVLELFKQAGDKYGWTRNLDRVGQIYMAMVAEAEGIFA